MSEVQEEKCNTPSQYLEGKYITLEPKYEGNWLVFSDRLVKDSNNKTSHDRLWFKIYDAYQEDTGLIWTAYTSTALLYETEQHELSKNGTIGVRTRDYRDLEDIVLQANRLRDIFGEEARDLIFYYKTVQASQQGINSVNCYNKISIYKSDPNGKFYRRNEDGIWERFFTGGQQ